MVLLQPLAEAFAVRHIKCFANLHTITFVTTKAPLTMRGDMQAQVLSHLPNTRLARSAEVGTSFTEHGVLFTEWLPRRHRVGPSASLDE
jgi:hypothetical protein